MSAMKEYRIPAPGGEITVQLSDDDAARYGEKAVLVEPVAEEPVAVDVEPVVDVKAKAPANKSKAPANTSADA